MLKDGIWIAQSLECLAGKENCFDCIVILLFCLSKQVKKGLNFNVINIVNSYFSFLFLWKKRNKKATDFGNTAPKSDVP
jgi:hypothetical protein